MALPVAVFGTEVVVQCFAHVSVYPGASINDLIQLSGAGAVLMLGWCAFQQPGNLQRFGAWAWLMSGLLGAEAIFQYFAAGKWIYGIRDATYADPIGPFVYHNHFAGCMEMLLPVAVVFAIRPGPVWRNIGMGAAPLIGFVSLMLAHSRGGFAIVCMQAVFAVALVSWNRRSLSWLRLTLLPLGLAVAIVALVGWQPLWQRFAQLAYHDPSANLRLAAAGITWKMFLARPLWGSGLGTFGTVFPHFRTFDDGLVWTMAHNDWLQMLAEMGGVGGVATLGFVVTFCAACWKVLHLKSNLASRLQLAAALGGIGLLAHSIIDFQLHNPANAMLFFLLTAALTADPPRVDQSRHRRRRRLPSMRPKLVPSAPRYSRRRLQMGTHALVLLGACAVGCGAQGAQSNPTLQNTQRSTATALPEPAESIPTVLSPDLVAPAAPSSYQIGADDLLMVYVYQMPEFTQQVRVDDAGNIQVSYLDAPVPVSGQTSSAVATEMEAALVRKGLANHPRVTVTVRQVMSQPVIVAGAVRLPLTIQAVRPFTLLELIARSGGLSSDPPAGAVAIVSHNRPDPTATSRVDLADLLTGTSPWLNTPIYGGAIVTVIPAPLVYAIGALGKPGAFPMRSGESISVLKAVALAEGIKEPASKGHAEIIHSTGDGQYAVVRVDVGRVLKHQAPDPVLQAGDILYIPDNRRAKALDAVLADAGQAAVIAVGYGKLF